MSKCWVQCAVLVKVISINFRVERYIAFKEKYTMHNKFSNFLCFFCAHLCAVPINFNCNK